MSDTTNPFPTIPWDELVEEMLHELREGHVEAVDSLRLTDDERLNEVRVFAAFLGIEHRLLGRS